MDTTTNVTKDYKKDNNEQNDDGVLELRAKKLQSKFPVASYQLASTSSKNNAPVRDSNRTDIVLRPDLSLPQPTLKLAHYRKPNYVMTQHGLYPQNLKAQRDLTGDRAAKAYSDSESDAAPGFAIDVHRIFDFSPKTPQEADIQNRVNSVPSLKQLNELRKYKMGVHPEKKFRLMLTSSPVNAESTTQFVKDHIVESDKEKRSIPFLDGMDVATKRSFLQSRAQSPPIKLSTAAEKAKDRKSAPDDVVVKSNPKYENSVKLAPMMTVDIITKSKLPGDATSTASLNSISTEGRSSSPIYSPATFRVPKPVDEDQKDPYDMYASKDTGGLLLSVDETAGATVSGGLSRMNSVSGARFIKEDPNQTANRLLAMQDSDSFQDSRREQFLQDSLAEDVSVRSDNTRSLLDQIRVTDIPGRSRIPKKYGHFVEELDAERQDVRTMSRQQRIRSSSPSGRHHDPESAEYEAMRRTGTKQGSKLKCSSCYVQAVLWCTSCIQAYCLACWNSVPHHTLYNMVPAFPNQLSKRYQQKFHSVVTEASTKYLDPAPAITTGKRDLDKPAPTMVAMPTTLSPATGGRPRSGNNRQLPNTANSSSQRAIPTLEWSPPQSPSTNHHPTMEADKSFSPKVLFASKKAARTAAAARAIENQLHRMTDTVRVFDGNSLPAKMPVVNQQTVKYQDYTIPGVILTGKGEVLEMTDEFSDSAPSPFYRNNSGGLSRPGTGNRKTTYPPKRSLSPEVNGQDNEMTKKENGMQSEPDFQGEVRNAIHYVLPSKTTRMIPLGMKEGSSSSSQLATVAPSGFDNSSPHKQLVRKITREGARNLQKKGDTRVFSPSFSLGGGGAVSSATAASSGGSSNIAATICRPSTVARPMTGIVKDIVFSSYSSTSALNKVSKGASDGDNTNWRDGNFSLKGSQKGEKHPKSMHPPQMAIYSGVPVYTRVSTEDTLNDPLKNFPRSNQSKPKSAPTLKALAPAT